MRVDQTGNYQASGRINGFIGLAVVTVSDERNFVVLENDNSAVEDIMAAVPPGDHEAMSEAITRMFNKPEEALKLGNAARNHVSSRFSLAKMVQRHVTLFEGLIDNE